MVVYNFKKMASVPPAEDFIDIILTRTQVCMFTPYALRTTVDVTRVLLYTLYVGRKGRERFRPLVYSNGTLYLVPLWRADALLIFSTCARFIEICVFCERASVTPHSLHPPPIVPFLSL